jgi:hypothetical protein
LFVEIDSCAIVVLMKRYLASAATFSITTFSIMTYSTMAFGIAKNTR